MLRFIFLMIKFCVVMSLSCPSDMNPDHRPRVSCVAQRLTAVPDGIKPDTQVLVLTENHFSTLSWSSYSGFKQLHELDLSHNHIATLEPPGPVLENLRVLRLSGNRLTGLGGLVFRCTPNLMEIYLDGNQIRSLHDASFSNLPHLEIINLSRNKLPALPPRLLERVSSSNLKTFDLENNSISLMPESFFSSEYDIPYVYLSQNPWLCSCAVGYLHSYLNDQEGSIYKHDEIKGVVLSPQSVVCSGPPHLFQRPIIELEENDFCPPEPTPSGDQDFKPISVEPNYRPQTQSAPHDTTTIPNLLASIQSWTQPGFWVTETWTETLTKTWTETWFVYWTMWEYFILNSTAGSVTLPTQSITSQPITSESPTTEANIPRSQAPSIAQLDPHLPSPMNTVQTEPPTIGAIPTQLDLHLSSPMITVTTEPPTTGASTTQLDPHLSSPMITVTTEPPTIGASTTQLDPHLSSPMITVQTEPPTTGASTTQLDPHLSSPMITVTTEPPTIGASTTQLDLHLSSPMITVTTEPPTTGASTTQLDPHLSSPMITVQTEPPTTGASTTQLDLHLSSPMITVTTEPPTIGAITTQLDPHLSSPMITVTSEPPTIGAITTQLDPHLSSPMITVQTEPPTIGANIATQPEPYTSRITVRFLTERIIPHTSVSPHWTDAHEGGGKILLWCWWLFAGFVFLCVLSALTSCFLSLWLLKIYLSVYRRLKNHGMARSGVILRAYRSIENSRGRENEDESVSFLSLEHLKDTRAVFRSVLFIKREEQHGETETKGRDASSKIELVSVAGQARDKEQEPAKFRKTLYREINGEEEADGWREGRIARYRLILREERGRHPEMQWVVGEWELGEEGMAYQRSCSLIGQPSTVALE
ncbi:platelet glycoprotein Ib alpha chain [Pseudorasbora parva]|uniref:platelet glycoprotein Ib alpha chain n=1 Tax=Pseudorasbora parva TaxID=51549 RepID=UPI00351E5EA4